ncbi:MAG: PilZ domain-containing protein [Sedimentisphaerales bacterium]|nr:PilZ domain-containing protein [Sedimentisphaerales bacterium]
MHKLICPSCDNSLFAAARDSSMPCPECGHMVSSAEERRDGDRINAQKTCDILKGNIRIPAKTVDISGMGLGIKLMGYLPFDHDETIHVSLDGNGEEKLARVVWTKKFYGISRAGLMFCA